MTLFYYMQNLQIGNPFMFSHLFCAIPISCTVMYLQDSWQALKCHPTQGCGNDIFLPLLIATSQLVADARKEDSLPACGENWVNTVDLTLPFLSIRADTFFTT